MAVYNLGDIVRLLTQINSSLLTLVSDIKQLNLKLDALNKKIGTS